jgi:DNA uptake protein ComE-like DNA-binding protein
MSGTFQSLFQFSKKERRVLAFWLLLILVIKCLPFVIDKYWPPEFPAVEVAAFSDLPAKEQNASDPHRSLIHPFPFDPNSLSDSGWAALGLNAPLCRTIRNYQSKGGRFRRAEDIFRIRGMDSAVATKLIPYVRIRQEVKAPAFSKAAHATQKIIEINAADSVQFLSLPGIGPVLAGRIVSFRKKLGGFVNTMQVKEVYGIKDSVFNIIHPLLKADTSNLVKIHLNAADFKELASHPYIKYAGARAIINYRNAHGPFRSVDDLRRILSLQEGWFEKASSYLTL